MPRSAGAPELDALLTLLGSASDLVGELVRGSTQRALRALAAIPPDQRTAVTTVLERAAETWRQNEAFNPLNQVRVRVNPNAQIVVRIFDDVDEPPSQEFDLLPEALRVMRRLGVGMRPELRASWEPAVVAARDMLTPEELADCARFLTRALELVSGATADGPAEADDASPELDEPRIAVQSKTAKRSRRRPSSR